MDASRWNQSRGICVSASVSKVSRFRLRSGEIGLLHGTAASLKQAAQAFLAGYAKAIGAMRVQGLVSHQMFYRVDAPNELIGIDLWHDGDAMHKAYASETGGFHELFAAKPATSMWKQPPGHWVEW